jgi:hypothetical protein
MVPRLWAAISDRGRELERSGGAGAGPAGLDSPQLEGMLCLFCQVLNHALVVVSDDDLLAAERAPTATLLSREALRQMCLPLKELAVNLVMSPSGAQPSALAGAAAGVGGGMAVAGSSGGGGGGWRGGGGGFGSSAQPAFGGIGRSGSGSSSELGTLLTLQLTKLLRALRERDYRRPFVSPPGDKAATAWLAGGSATGIAAAIMAVVQLSPPPPTDADTDESLFAQRALHQGVPGGAAEMACSMALLRTMPFTLPFEGRLTALRAWIAADRNAHGGFELAHHRKPPPIRVRRPHLFDDSFRALRSAGGQLKLPLRVRFFNEQVRATGGGGGGDAGDAAAAPATSRGCWGSPCELSCTLQRLGLLCCPASHAALALPVRAPCLANEST